MNSPTLLVIILMLLATGRCSELRQRPMPNCPTSCGNVTIPFPFGITSDCSLDVPFLITCNHSFDPPKPFSNMGSTEVLNISLNGLMKVASPVASDCYDDSGSQIRHTTSELTLSNFPVSSTRNKFTAVGCDTYALLQAQGSEGQNKMRAGCVSWCDSVEIVKDGDCFGIGCCQSSIPKGLKDILVNIKSDRNHSGVRSFNPCGYAFVVETDAFKFSPSDLKNLQDIKSVPVVLDWSVGDLSCHEVQYNLSSYACRSTNSECIDSSSGVGYHCKCSSGFQGNPYLVDGCQDIDECNVSTPCQGTCKNLNGSYLCSCPLGFKGDGKKYGSGCYPEGQTSYSTFFYISSVIMVPALGSSWIIWRRRQKKVVKLRQSLFIRNGGELLDAMQSIQKTLSIFTAEDLKKATNDYDENNVLCEEHFGITYKGILPGVSRIVTIKSCHAFDQCNVEVLISKLVTLSQIYHKNVVKLLGCCLETQVPLVVYEFITVKSLSDYITDDLLARSLSWDIRLRIAADIAGVMAYMHSATSVPIIHGSLNSSCILLHHGYAVKVHGFALTCSECSCVRLYGRTSGFVDPDYLSSVRLTEKSDVYSFGFILAELMTGKDTMSLEWLEGEENIAKYFAGSSRGRELRTILDDRVVTDGFLGQLTDVAEIAKLCLLSSSRERPTMKEVAIALECIIIKGSRRPSTQTRASRRLLLDSSDQGCF